jgi:hypothetical protein
MKEKLLENAIDFNKKGISYYVEKDLKHCLINIAVSAELLCKTFLSGINPCLIIDRDFDSLLHVCGQSKHAKKSPGNIRTIGANEAFTRCTQLIPKLKDYEKEMVLLFNFRNGVLHLAEYEKEFAKKVFSPYLKVIQILLETMNTPLTDFFKEYSKLAETNIQESINEINIEVERLVAKAKLNFQKRFDGVEDSLKKSIIKNIADSYALTNYEKLIDCPVCNSDAVITGATAGVDWEVDYDSDGTVSGAYPIVQLIAVSLKCNVCGLELNTSEEIDAAGVVSCWDTADVDPADFYEPDFDDIGD